MAEKPGIPLTTVLAAPMQIHVNAPYLLNHALESLLRGHGHAASPILSTSPTTSAGARQRQTYRLRRQQSGVGHEPLVRP